MTCQKNYTGIDVPYGGKAVGQWMCHATKTVREVMWLWQESCRRTDVPSIFLHMKFRSILLRKHCRKFYIHYKEETND